MTGMNNRQFKWQLKTFPLATAHLFISTLEVLLITYLLTYFIVAEFQQSNKHHQNYEKNNI